MSATSPMAAETVSPAVMSMQLPTPSQGLRSLVGLMIQKLRDTGKPFSCCDTSTQFWSDEIQDPAKVEEAKMRMLNLQIVMLRKRYPDVFAQAEKEHVAHYTPHAAQEHIPAPQEAPVQETLQADHAPSAPTKQSGGRWWQARSPAN